MSSLALLDCADTASKLYLAVRSADGGHVSNGEVTTLCSVLDAFRRIGRGAGDEGTLGGTLAKEDQIFSAFRTGLQDAAARTSPPPQGVVIGLSAFWRRLSAKRREEIYDNVLCPLREVAQDVLNVPCDIVPLSDRDEAYLERRSVEYAAEHSALRWPEVDLVVSGGIREVNVSPPQGSQAPPVVVPLDLRRGEDVVAYHGLTVWESECFVQFDRAAGVYCSEHFASPPPPDGRLVVATGSMFFAGKFAELAGSEQPRAQPLPFVLERFAAKLGAAQVPIEPTRLSPSSDVDTRRLNGNASEFANLIRIKACLKTLFPSHQHGMVRVVFGRDWPIRGTKLRTTWTSGYFIRLCVDGVHPLGLVPLHRDPRRIEERGWLDLTDEGSGHCGRLLCFQDKGDSNLHEVPYSTRLRLLELMPATPLTYRPPEPRKVLWTRVATCEEFIGVGPGQPVGLQIALPAADGISGFVVVGLVSGAAGVEGRPPCPALGFNRRQNSFFPVVDVGVCFDANANVVKLQKGSVPMNKFGILGTSLCARWSSTSAAVYNIWLRPCANGRTELRFARNRRGPVSTRKSDDSGETEVEVWKHVLDAEAPSLPAAVHIWVGALVDAEGRHKGSWDRLTYSMMRQGPQGCAWAAGRAKTAMRLWEQRLEAAAQNKLPRWIAQSFREHHDGEEGIRRLAVWPPDGDAPPSPTNTTFDVGNGLVVTSGESDIWCFAGHGEALYHCHYEHAEVWGVAILSVKARWKSSSLNLSRASTRRQLTLRLLIGFKAGDSFLREQSVDVDNPEHLGCECVEHIVTEERMGTQTDRWGRFARINDRGHTDAVTGICLDYQRQLVYTVSYDFTAIQWDLDGHFRCQARGFHSDKIYNCALSREGCWLATAGFDHVALFRCGELDGLTCAALIDISWGSGRSENRRWFAVAFLPERGDIESTHRTVESVGESLEELPSGMVVGDNHGAIWVVPLLDEIGRRRSAGGATHFVSIAEVGIPLAPHKTCVRQLLWIDSPRLARFRWKSRMLPRASLVSPWASACWRRWLCGGKIHSRRRSDERYQMRPSLTGAPTQLELPLLVSTSTDKTVRVFDWDTILTAFNLRAIRAVGSPSSRSMNGCDTSSPRKARKMSSAISKIQSTISFTKSPDCSPLRQTRISVRRSKLGNEDLAAVHALEITFHEGPVRAAGCDAFGRLWTASKRIAQWDGLDHYTHGDVVLEPKLAIRRASAFEVAVYFSNIAVFAFQILRFTARVGRFASEDRSYEVVSSVAVVGDVLMVSFVDLGPTAWPFWRTLFFLLVSSTVFCFPVVLATFYDAMTRYEIDEHDLKMRARQRRRMAWCTLATFLLFGCLVIPTFQEFAALINCPSSEDGVRRMALHPETQCFRDTHLVFTVLCVFFGLVYLACGLLLERVNYSLPALLESKLASEASFPADEHRGRKITIARFILLLARMSVPGARLEIPKVYFGVFTETDWAVYSRQVRFLSKVFVAGLGALSGLFWDRNRLLAASVIALVCLLVVLVLPPLLDRRCRRFINILHLCTFAASMVSLAATGYDVDDSLSLALAWLYVAVAVLPVFAYTCVLPLLRHYCGLCCVRCCRADEEDSAPSHSEMAVRVAWPDHESEMPEERGSEEPQRPSSPIPFPPGPRFAARALPPMVEPLKRGPPQPDCTLVTPSSSPDCEATVEIR